MKFLATLTCAALMATTACAQPATKASIDKLMEVSNAKKMFDNMMPQLENFMTNMSRQQADELKQSPDTRQFTENLNKKMIGLLKEDMSWEKVSAIYAKVYSTVFSDEDIQQLIKLYQSPTGHMMLKKMPLLTQQLLIQTQQLMRGEAERVSAVMAEAIKEETAKEIAKAKKHEEAQKNPAT